MSDRITNVPDAVKETAATAATAPTAEYTATTESPAHTPHPAYDALIIGAGAAGLSTALVLGRARRRVLVVDGGEPRNAPAAQMHGFLSRDGMPPADFLAVGRAEIARYGVEILTGHVDDIVPRGRLDPHDTGADPEFAVYLAGGPVLTTRHVVVATGLRDDLPDLPGLRDRWGVDVLHCPYCHGYEVRDQPLGVLATQPHSVEHALLVRQWSPDIVYFTHGTDPSPADRERLAARGIRIEDGEVKRIVADGGRLRGVELADGRVVPRTAVFAGPTFEPHDGLLDAVDCARNPDGWVAVDPSGRTSVPGVWAAGNAVDPRAQVITAAAHGSAVAAALNHDLVTADVTRAVAEARTASLPPFGPRPVLT
ncbi:MAG: NAD(P)/FAD-dependent oxidoreductase [Streptomycetaceae bacterium]|nr:NAD(P)/FAD-dependent oxidoreductase [Streptomycetaceae bacterium]